MVSAFLFPWSLPHSATIHLKDYPAGGTNPMLV
jgi:hypothetical protein